jgi:hypothetical protein
MSERNKLVERQQSFVMVMPKAKPAVAAAAAAAAVTPAPVPAPAAALAPKQSSEVDAEAEGLAIHALDAANCSFLGAASALRGGCGPGDGIGNKLVPDINMHEACGLHDNCYRTCGSVKATCDANFLTNMNNGCQQKFAPRES